jgi:hypothetical protein
MPDQPTPTHTPTITPTSADQQPAFTPSPLQQGPTPGTQAPWDGDQAFVDLVKEKGYSCPGSNAGDYAFTAWLYDFYLAAKGVKPQAQSEESKPSGKGTSYGALSPGGKWMWKGTGQADDDWVKTEQHQEQKRTSRHDSGTSTERSS